MRAEDCSEAGRARPVGAEFFITWFVGSYDAAIRILARLGNASSEVKQFWRATFPDPADEEAFLLLWPDARRVGHWAAVDDIVQLEWVRERGATVEECVEITFYSGRSRAEFLANVDP